MSSTATTEADVEDGHDEAAAVETIDFSDVADLRGTLSEQGSVDVELEDGRVVTAIVDAVRRGEHTCPAEGCIRQFETDKGLRVHLGHCHPELRNQACASCGGPFHSAPSHDSQYCSWACYIASRTATSVCETCGSEFEHKTSVEPRYCSNPCRYEGMRNDERPDDVHDLLYELRVEEGRDRETTIDRALANLGVDTDWTRHTLHEVLVTEVDDDPLAGLDLPERVTEARVREAVADATTMLEVQRDLRISRQRTRRALYRLGLTDVIGGDESVVEAARKRLGLDEDGNSVDVPEGETGWTQFSERGGDSV